MTLFTDIGKTPLQVRTITEREERGKEALADLPPSPLFWICSLQRSWTTEFWNCSFYETYLGSETRCVLCRRIIGRNFEWEKCSREMYTYYVIITLVNLER